METQSRPYYRSFPAQLWVLVVGGFINSLGGALVFPFLTLYLRQRLGISLLQVGLVFTVNAAVSLFAGMLGGFIADRFGRRRVMLVSLLASSVVLLLMGLASTYAQMVALAAAIGLAGPVSQPARDAMIADLTQPAQRPEAYSVLRVATNLGYAIGPAVGGFLASVSYLLSFGLAASASLAVFVLTWFLVRETLTEAARAHASNNPSRGFGPVFRDTPFMLFCVLGLLTAVAYAQVTTNLPVHMKESLGLGERYFGWVMTTNAAMVVTLQMAITRAIARWPRLPTLALGAALYGVGLGAIGLMSAFPGLIACAVIYTMGEMVISPTANAFTADQSPADMRGRYMGLLALTWGVAYGIGPALGGAMYDAGLKTALWFAAGGLGLLTALGYLALQRYVRARASHQ
ncbi:MAG: MFS transporter [Anaerolineae bacterium]|nr:MFS transporter [Anaerolineae bacterium]